MATPTYQQLITLTSSQNGLQAESMEERILTVLAMLATGTNPDGTNNPAISAANGSNVFVPWNVIGTSNTLYASSIATASGNFSTGLNTLATSFPWFTGPTPVVINQFAINVATAYAAGGVLRFGVYTVNNQSTPFVYVIGAAYGTLLQEVGQISTVATGQINFNLSAPYLTIPPNTWFFLAGSEQVSASGNRHIGVNTQSSPSPYGVANFAGGQSFFQAVGLGMSGVTGALPVSFLPTQNLATDSGISFARQA